MATSAPVALPAAPPHVPNLLGLPAEVRTIIYGHLPLFVPQPMTIGACGYDSTKHLDFHFEDFVKPDTSILSCSRQIRAEAMPIFYGQNTFQIFAVDDITLFRASPYRAVNLNLIKHIVVHMSDSYNYIYNPNVWNRARVEELRWMAALDRVTVVIKDTDASEDVATRMVTGNRIGARNSTAAAFMTIMENRPAISCRLILEKNTRLGPVTSTDFQVEHVIYSLAFNDDRTQIKVHKDRQNQWSGEINYSYPAIFENYTR